MGKGHERLHARTRAPADEMERRWLQTFGGLLVETDGGDTGDDRSEGRHERTGRDLGSTPSTSTTRARFCNRAGPMGGGCEDSWHVGGNYGSHVCLNPEHHDGEGDHSGE